MPRPDLMEAGEAAAVVGAILWLAQTILETLQAGKLADWLRQVGLTSAIEELKSEVERMETVVNGVNGRAVGNMPLARSLARVKELMYDADDVVDELDYCRLQQQVEGVMFAPAIELEAEGMVGDGAGYVDASGSTAGIPDNNGRKNRSKERDYFHITPAVNGEPAKAKCIDCDTEVLWGHGTSVLRKHRNSTRCKNNKRAAIEKAPNCPSASDRVQNGATVSTNDSEGRKRMRTECSVATTTHLWDKAEEFLKRIQEITLDLQISRGNVTEYLKDSVARFGHYQSNSSDTQVRTSSSLPGNVYGRNVEKREIIRAIKAAKSDNVTVLPIVGILGVGKTTLAKLVYHDQHVERKFERIWIWVSNIFDEVRVTREILDVVTLASHEGSCKRESYEGVSNYSKLLEALKKHVACLSKKFLLVLDDVYDCMGNSQWKDLVDALGSSYRKGNVIIVTARNLSVVKRLGTSTIKPVRVRALGNDDFLQLFRACAFGDNNYKEHLDTSLQICAKLKGNPLAAESAAEILREQPILDHWKNIIKNGIWESLQLHGGIVTALKNIYYDMPYNLQQCFLACSVFPNDHQFHIDGLISMWISSGFVKSVEIGRGYLNALVNSCVIEQVGTEDNSILHNQQCYVMCGMMHEFARLVSETEFATIDGLECKEVLPTVRHCSILTDSVYHRDEQGFILRNVEFEGKLQSLVSSVKRLRMLILIGNFDPLFLRSFHTFMCNSVNYTHLRYLKLENKGSSEDLPISLSKFYHLEALDVEFEAIHDMSDLISMRHLVLKKGAHVVSSAWSACLQTIHIEDCGGWETLPSLEGLSFLTKLKLRNMPDVMTLLIPLLEELVLIDMPKLCTCITCSVRDLNSSLRILEIRRCQVLVSFPLFDRCGQFQIEQKSWLPNVNELTVHECSHLMVSNPLPPSSTFCKLSIRKLSTFLDMEGSSNGEMEIAVKGDLISDALSLDDKILSFRNLRTITRLKLKGFGNLSYFSIEGLKQLVCLKRLKICSCSKFSSLHVLSTRAHEDMSAVDFDALPSLECLIIKDCGAIGEWLSVMLQHVRALEELHLVRCEQITWLLKEGEENSFSNVILAPRPSSQGNLDSASTRSCLDELLLVPSNLVSSLKKISIEYCKLKFRGNKEGFSVFTSLEELRIHDCSELISSLVHEDEIDDRTNGRWLLPCSLGVLGIRGSSLGTLQPCFLRDLTRLKALYVWHRSELKCLQLHSCTALEKLTIGYCKSLDALEGFQCLHNLVCFEVYKCLGLKSLQLHSCTALEKLTIECCESLETLEGVQSLRSLRYLKVYKCPALPQCLESLSTQGYELCPRLEKLRINDLSFLTTSFCKHLTCLQCLQLGKEYEFIDAAGLTCEQEAALQLLTSLKELRFHNFPKLSDLPVGVRSLLSLKRLKIRVCPSISSLPEKFLSPSLEELEVFHCSEELTKQCRKLATSKLNVKIDWAYVN